MPVGANSQNGKWVWRGEEQVIVSPEHRRPAVLHLISCAERRIALSMFRCTDFEVLDALAEALTRNVQVDLLLTQRAKGWEKKIRDLGLYLESMGAKVHRYSLPRVKYHAKYLLVDDGPAMVVSWNFTRKCFETTSDFLLVTADQEIISSLGRLFDHDIRTPDQPLPPGIASRLIVGPDRARIQFRELIASARKSLRIVDHRVTDPEMVRLLLERQAAGVAVEVFGKGSVHGLKSHGKMMLIDNETAVLGSISLSTPSLDLRREMAVVVQNKAAVARLAEFLKKAQKGHPPSALVSAAASLTGPEEEDEEEESES